MTHYKNIHEVRKAPTAQIKKLYRTLNVLLHKYGRVCLNGTTASYDTFHKRKRFCEKSFRDLHEAGFLIIDVYSLKEKHVHALFSRWLDDENKPTTLANKISLLRVFESWINKPYLTNTAIKSYSQKDKLLSRSKILPMKERPDKSLSGNGIDPIDVIKILGEEDPRIALQATLQYIFGLRKEESMKFKPVDDGEIVRIQVHKGAKGGRFREGIEPLLPPDSAWAFLEFLKEYVGHQRGVSLIPEDMSFDQWKRHYDYICQKVGFTKKKMGVTSHSLRQEYAQASYEQTCNEIAPIAKKCVNALSIKQQRHNAKLKVAQMLGHNRKDIATAYGL